MSLLNKLFKFTRIYNLWGLNVLIVLENILILTIFFIVFT